MQDPTTPPSANYPLPAHAATIWSSGPNLWLILGPTERDGRSHKVTVPATEAGLATLLRLLRDRETSGPLPIGSPGSPDQALLVHQRRHQIWASPMCPHCRAEGRQAVGVDKPIKPSPYTSVRQSGDVTIRKLRPGLTAKRAAAETSASAPAIITKSLAELGL